MRGRWTTFVVRCCDAAFARPPQPGARAGILVPPLGRAPRNLRGDAGHRLGGTKEAVPRASAPHPVETAMTGNHDEQDQFVRGNAVALKHGAGRCETTDDLPAEMRIPAEESTS